MGTALAAIAPPVPAQLASEPIAARLASIAFVPDGHDVAAVAGMVVVYDRLQSRLEPGAVFVIEHQQPRSGMSWDIFHRIRSTRLDTSREIVRVEPSRSHAGYWRRERADAVWNAVDDVDELSLADMIVGRVVGVYRPEAS